MQNEAVAKALHGVTAIMWEECEAPVRRVPHTPLCSLRSLFLRLSLLFLCFPPPLLSSLGTVALQSPSHGKAAKRMAADFQDVLRRRLVDSKGAVRKAAVSCLEAFILSQSDAASAPEVSCTLGSRVWCLAALLFGAHLTFHLDCRWSCWVRAVATLALVSASRRSFPSTPL